MKLIFLSDYLGRETAMKQYRKGDIADIPIAQALALIRLEVAEEVEAVQDTPPIFRHTPKRRKIQDGDE